MNGKRDDLTYEYVDEILHYEPSTGIFTWKKDRGARAKKGQVAGSTASKYSQIQIDGALYTKNRLAWLLMTGEWPVGHVDHKNLDKRDDRWVNLRAATTSQNMRNTPVRKNNRTGFKGVVGLPSGRFQAAIYINGKQKYLGSFDTAQEASDAYLVAAKKNFGEFARAQ